MPMSHKGLNKLVEECGELIQVAAKKMQFMEEDDHPDGAGSLKRRLEEEMADVLAAITTVKFRLGLDSQFIARRQLEKEIKFIRWTDDGKAT